MLLHFLLRKRVQKRNRRSSTDASSSQCISDLRQRLLKAAIAKQPHILSTVDNQQIKVYFRNFLFFNAKVPTLYCWELPVMRNSQIPFVCLIDEVHMCCLLLIGFVANILPAFSLLPPPNIAGFDSTSSGRWWTINAQLWSNTSDQWVVGTTWWQPHR